jgi:hypothetical protein
MTEQEVVDLMASSRSDDEWNDNADKVKKACKGYPSFWFNAVIKSGVAARTIEKFGGSPAMKVTIFK